MNLRLCVYASVMSLGVMWVGGSALGQGAPTPPPAGRAPVPTPAPTGSGAAPTAVPAGAAATPAVPAPTPLPSVSIPPAAYTSPAAQRAAIKTFVDTYVQRLTNDADPLNQSVAREELSKAVYEKGQPAQPDFLFEYSRVLNDALLTALKSEKATMRQRLNIAIVAQRVATVAQNVALQETVLQLINDKDEPIVLWGLKAAGPIVKEVVKMKQAGAPPLLAAIVPAVLKHPSGEIYDEAYGALTTSGDPLVVAELMKLWENRLLQYQNGVPDNASADARPVIALTTKQMWGTVLKDKDPRTKVMQMISDQISMAATHADNPANKDKRDQLVSLVQKTAEGIIVVALNEKIPTLQSAASAAAGLKPENTPASQKISSLVNPAVTDAIQKAFPGVKPPPAPAAAGVAQQQPQ